ncbi:hypothetical protein ACWD6R_21390 [Streptomyces sp. NPDC005151]
MTSPENVPSWRSRNRRTQDLRRIRGQEPRPAADGEGAEATIEELATLLARDLDAAP